MSTHIQLSHLSQHKVSQHECLETCTTVIVLRHDIHGPMDQSHCVETCRYRLFMATASGGRWSVEGDSAFCRACKRRAPTMAHALHCIAACIAMHCSAACYAPLQRCTMCKLMSFHVIFPLTNTECRRVYQQRMQQPPSIRTPHTTLQLVIESTIMPRCDMLE